MIWLFSSLDRGFVLIYLSNLANKILRNTTQILNKPKTFKLSVDALVVKPFTSVHTVNSISLKVIIPIKQITKFVDNYDLLII